MLFHQLVLTSFHLFTFLPFHPYFTFSLSAHNFLYVVQLIKCLHRREVVDVET